MKQYQFKTNISCSGCVAKVSPALDLAPEVKEWKVDTSHPDKILTIKTENFDEDDVKSIISKSGFKAESI